MKKEFANIQTFEKFIFESKNRKALFMDLDHTIIKPKSGKTFPINIDDWVFIPNVLDVMKKFKEYIIIIVSNQGGIEYGYHSEDDIIKKFKNIIKKAKEKGVNIEKFYFCKSNDKTNLDRKPNPGMIYKASEEYNINIGESIMVGDLDSDRQLADNAKIGKYYDIKDFLNL